MTAFIAGHANKTARPSFDRYSARRRERIDPGRAVGLELRRAVLIRALCSATWPASSCLGFAAFARSSGTSNRSRTPWSIGTMSRGTVEGAPV